VFIEERQSSGRHVHRISAQRALNFADNVTQRPIEAAERLLLWGHDTQINNKNAYRWGSNPTSHMLNDYDAVLSLVYARERRRDSEVVGDIREGISHQPDTIPESELDTVKRIWADVLPHRDLGTSLDSIEVGVLGGTPYVGREMGDGERGAIYLMAECLCAPENGVLVIDEPEIHLHRSIQGRLWDELEALRAPIYVNILYTL